MIRVALAFAAFFVIGLVSCSAIYGQALDFKVDGPVTVAEGDYVELTVLFPEGVKADVDFTPIEESDFGVHPVVSETLVKGKLTATVVGRKCTFSARCQGERDLIVVATAFANFDGVPRLKSLKHEIRVTANQAPKPPPVPPKEDPPAQPRDDDDLGPWVPLPGAAALPPPNDDMEKVTKILSNVLDRLEAIENRATQVTAVARQNPVVSPPETASVPVKHEVIVARQISAPVTSTRAVPFDSGGPHWTIDGVANPSKELAVSHLRHDVKHESGTFDVGMFEPLEQWSRGQLLTIHDHHHKKLGPPIASGSTATRAVVSSPVSVYTQPIRYAQPASGCPGGVCPTPSRSYSTGRGIFGFRR